MESMSRSFMAALLLAPLACVTFLPSVALPPPIGPVKVRIGVESDDLWSEFEAAPGSAAERRARLVESFAARGCPRSVESIEAPTTPVICRLPGETRRSIVIVSDYSRAGRRKPDGWLGAALLPGLYYALAVEPRHHTLVFVAFERGRSVSEAGGWPISLALEALDEQEIDQIEAVVGVRAMNETHLAALGGGHLGLFVDLRAVERALETPVRSLRPRRKDDLMEPVPAMVRPGGSPVPAISLVVAERGLSDYLDSFRFVATFVAYVDETFVRRSESVGQPEQSE
jgi:hypothetical protein